MMSQYRMICAVDCVLLFWLSSMVGVGYCTSSMSSWSPCSHSCNGGIMSRDCVSGNCTHYSSQYMSCNNQNCATVMMDPRDQQCATDATKYFPNLNWKSSKYARVPELCELFCVAESHAIQITLPINLGTPCVRDNGSNGRCIGKLCAPIGCDGVLGSGADYDKCHRCPVYPSHNTAATNEDCKHFKNSLNIADNSPHSTVASFIPINSMSVTINFTHELDLVSVSESYHVTSNVEQFSLDGSIFTVNPDLNSVSTAGPLTQALTIILKGSSGDNVKQSSSVSYSYHLLVPVTDGQSTWTSNSSYTWVHGDFGPCSVTCGGGIIVSHAHCRDSAFPNKIMPDKFCHNTEKPFPIVERCSRGDCPARWETSEWGVCSTSCDNGTQYRDVKCWKIKEDGSDFYVSSSQCSGLPKPASSKPCYIRPCGTQWEASDWSMCSRRCGIGIQNRTVNCIDQSQNVVTDIYCLEDNVNKPPSIRPCDRGPCYYSWYTSEWSKCSQQCGEGYKTRTVYCSDQNIIPVNDSNCANLTKPSSQQPCHEVTGCFSAWITSPWGPCQGPCGSAHQTRSVDCYVFVGDEVENIPGRCNNNTKPSHSQSCPEHECAQWTTGEWSECSATCGPGTKQRAVKCMRGNELSSECDLDNKPPDSAPCDNAPCSDCVDNPMMNCGQMKTSFGCSLDFVRQFCCQTCTY